MAMRRILRHFKKTVILALCLCLAVTPSGCGKKKDSGEQTKISVYYINKDTTKLVPKEYSLDEADTEAQVKKLIARMSRDTDDVDAMRAIPDNVKLEDWSIAEGMLTLSFTAEYGTIPKDREVLTRAAIVLTMTQLPDVESVFILANGEPVLLSDGKTVGSMTASDFADNLDSNKLVYNTDTFSVYFATPEGTELTKYDFETEYGSDTSKEQVIINKLLEGPAQEEGYLRTVPANVEIVDIFTTDNICYVTFGENFLTEQASVSDPLVIYSIVNSLSELASVHKVQISVRGQTDAVYHGTIPLSEPFTRNLDYVAKEPSR